MDTGYSWDADSRNLSPQSLMGHQLLMLTDALTQLAKSLSDSWRLLALAFKNRISNYEI